MHTSDASKSKSISSDPFPSAPWPLTFCPARYVCVCVCAMCVRVRVSTRVCMYVCMCQVIVHQDNSIRMYFYKACDVFKHASKIDRPFIHIEHNGNNGMAGHFSSFVGPSDMPGLARVAADTCIA